MIHLGQSIWSRRMPFWKTGHAESKPAWIRMGTRFIESLNKFYQVDRVSKRITQLVIRHVMRSIASKRENVSNPGLGVSKQYLLDFLFVVTNASQVRDRG